MEKTKMHKFNVTIIHKNLTETKEKPVWASTIRSALNIAATRRYGPYGWEIVCDDTVMGQHVNRRNAPQESLELH